MCSAYYTKISYTLIMKILLLEDDIILSEIIEEYLISLDNEVVCAYDGFSAAEYGYEQSFDLLLLDVEVPGIDGFEFLKSLREQDINTPAIFITSLNQSDDLEKGFEVGCDDYIKKPFELKELKIRINNIKRLYNIDSNSVFNISKDITYNFSTKVILNENIELSLSKKETMILEYFIQQIDKVVSAQELISNIWGYDESPTNATIRTYIKNIRKAIGEDILKTVKGIGYKLETR